MKSKANLQNYAKLFLAESEPHYLEIPVRDHKQLEERLLEVLPTIANIGVPERCIGYQFVSCAKSEVTLNDGEVEILRGKDRHPSFRTFFGHTEVTKENRSSLEPWQFSDASSMVRDGECERAFTTIFGAAVALEPGDKLIHREKYKVKTYQAEEKIYGFKNTRDLLSFVKGIYKLPSFPAIGHRGCLLNLKEGVRLLTETEPIYCKNFNEFKQACASLNEEKKPYDIAISTVVPTSRLGIQYTDFGFVGMINGYNVLTSQNLHQCKIDPQRIFSLADQYGINFTDADAN